ncbi:MAG: putative toxin-antitoxin system toxin component, PIN family [Bacteroidia bacterium]
MRIVLDTNVLLTSLLPTSPNYWLLNAYFKKEFSICISPEILFEYEELLNRWYGVSLTEEILQLFIIDKENLLIEDYKRWNLIATDPDDNKFVDCAIAGKAKFIVSEDRHFQILKTISWPKVEVLTIEEFKKELEAAGKL